MAFVLRRIIQLSALQSPQLLAAANTKFVHHSRTLSDDAALKSATPDTDNFKLNVSDSCIKRLREICQDGSFLRITVEGGGCSGFQYKFDLDKQLNADDRAFGEEVAKVVIDNVSLEYCSGATVDYHVELIRSGFKILANPQAEMGCSCGSSFAIKLD